MVIKASAAAEIRALIEALGGADDVMREAAIARLAVIGGRAIEKLAGAYADARDTREKLAILRTFEAIGDPRGIEVAQKAMNEGGDAAVAGAAVLRGLLDSPHADVSAAALDTLVSTIVSAGVTSRTRAAALDALQDMPAPVRARIAEAVKFDPIARDDAARLEGAAGLDGIWTDAVEGRMPDDAAALKTAVHARAASAALTALGKMVAGARAKEGDAGTPAARADWMDLRGALHRALALRGSRVALYDLRESLTAASRPLPVSFLAAVQVLGDASCLEPIATAYKRARPEDRWWRQQLAAAFHAICKRERITKRHAVMKRIAARCPDLLS